MKKIEGLQDAAMLKGPVLYFVVALAVLTIIVGVGGIVYVLFWGT